MRKEWGLAILLVAGLLCLAPNALADWSPAKRLTWTKSWCQNPDISIDSSNKIHVVWEDLTSGNFEIYYCQSTDGGTNFSAGKQLTSTTGDSWNAAIATDTSNAVHVVWDDDTPGNREIYYRRSTNGGMTWGVPQRLTWTPGYSCFPNIAIDQTKAISVVWQDKTPQNDEIYYKRSTDGGATWGPVKRLTFTAAGSWDPAVAIDLNYRIHVVWEDITPGNTEIYYKSSTDGGATWSANKRQTWTSGHSYFPNIGLSSGDDIHIVWEDNTPLNPEIYYKNSLDGGVSWGAAKRLTFNSGYSYIPDMAIDSTNIIHVVWDDDTTGSFMIYYKKSADGGATWTTAQKLTSTTSGSEAPAIATDSTGTVHLVWMDLAPGKWEIYYKKGK